MTVNMCYKKTGRGLKIRLVVLIPESLRGANQNIAVLTMSTG